MEAKEKIDLYFAISEMRRISAAGGTFSLRFRKWNRATKRGGDIVTVNAARVRPKAYDEEIENADYKLFFTDTETGEPRVCWECLIVEFNGMSTVLN